MEGKSDFTLTKVSDNARLASHHRRKWIEGGELVVRRLEFLMGGVYLKPEG
jgi:hypothetical protein